MKIATFESNRKYFPLYLKRCDEFLFLRMNSFWRKRSSVHTWARLKIQGWGGGKGRGGGSKNLGLFLFRFLKIWEVKICLSILTEDRMVFKENVIGWGQPLRPPTHLPFIPHLVSCRPHKKIFSNQISRGNFGTGERERKTPILSFYATFIFAL